MSDSDKPPLFGFDAYSPREIAERVESAGVAKARLSFLPMAMLSVLAGAFIGLGGLYFTLVVSDASLGFAAGRVLGGLVFSLGLILVVVAGAELFTGNNLLVMAWADGKISSVELLRNWGIVFSGNFIGALGLAIMVFLSGHPEMNEQRVGETYVRIAAAKCSMPFMVAFFKGVLCNALVCLAVWLAMAGRSVTDKIMAIIFPISAFVALGFEHSIANLYFIPMGLLLRDTYPGVAGVEAITLAGFAKNLIPVVLGNIVGGSVLVGLVYTMIYGRGAGSGPSRSSD